MLSDPFLINQLQLAALQVETWRQINPRDNSLLRKKLMRATKKAASEIKKRTAQIRFANRLNCNHTGIELQIVNMWGEKINELAETVYGIFCKEWELRGNKRTAIFVRAAAAQLLQMIERWGHNAASGAGRLHLSRGGIGRSTQGYYIESAQKLREDWKEKLDIEARELDLVASVGRAEKRANLILPSPEQSRNPPAVTNPVDLFAIANPGEIVVESGPLSDTDTTAAAVKMLQKLGFGRENAEWPSPPFGPVLPSVLSELKRARRILTTTGFQVVGDPVNPLGDGRSWVLRFEPTDKLRTNADLGELADRHLQSEGIRVAAKPIQDGRSFMVALWDSGRISEARNNNNDLVGRIEGKISDSAFWRDLADQFLALQDRLRDDSKPTDLTYRSFNVLAKKGAFAIGAAPDVWVWVGAVMKEDPDFRSSYLDKEASGEAESVRSLVMGEIDRFCQLSATFCKTLEDQAVQAEFEAHGRSAGRTSINSWAPLSTFETTVGELMVQARKVCPTKHLPQTEISKIAALLDNKNTRVRDNLEREAARTMAEYNQRHPKAAIKTWKSASCHPQFRRAVRKRFSRAEEKYKKAPPPVAGPSAGTPRTTI